MLYCSILECLIGRLLQSRQFGPEDLLAPFSGLVRLRPFLRDQILRLAASPEGINQRILSQSSAVGLNVFSEQSLCHQGQESLLLSLSAFFCACDCFAFPFYEGVFHTKRLLAA